MTLARRMTGMVLPALVALSALAVVSVFGDVVRIRRLRTTRADMGIAIEASRLVHEVQRERGMTAGFLASGGQKFVAELPRQRTRTDEAAAALARTTSALAHEGLARPIQAAEARLGDLAATRTAADARTLAPKASFTFYTGLVEAWLAVVEEAAREGDDADTVRALTAYLAFLRGKEDAGRERATLNNVFAADAFDAETHRRLLGILAAEDLHFAAFQASATPEASARFAEVLAPERFTDVTRLRDLALARVATGKFGVEPKTWFDAITRKIDAMKEVEDALSASLLEHVERSLGGAWLSLAVTLALLALALGLAVLSALKNGRAIVAALGGEPEDVAALARRVAAGDLDDVAMDVPSGSALEAVQHMARDLRGILGDVRERLGRIARGDLPPSSDAPFPGVFDDLRVGLNASSEAIRRLLDDTRRLESAARMGDLSVRVDPSAHDGDFARVVAGFDETLDAVTAPIAEARAALDRLAGRDLTARVEGLFEGDHALMQQAINRTAVGLEGAIAEVAHAAAEVSGAAERISTSAVAVARGTEEEANVIEGTRRSVVDLAEKMRGVVANAGDARARTSDARSAVEQSAKTLQRSVVIIGEVRRSADASMEIIRDISQIAAQTSFLSLNATIEAARAGAAGRGFAIVAEEVRALATRAKEAARKTEELIRLSVKSTAEGEASVQKATDELRRVVEVVDHVATDVSGIADATGAQAHDVDAVRTVFEELAVVVERNRAASEDSKAVAARLDERAAVLTSLVDEFNVAQRAANPGAAGRSKLTRAGSIQSRG